MRLNKLNKEIITCRKCIRLVNFREKIANEKRRQYLDQTYWGKPITGYGDSNAQLLMIGLAPAAHGGNRTGRVFTGDKSSDFLYKNLFNVKISNQNYSKLIKKKPKNISDIINLSKEVRLKTRKLCIKYPYL